MNENIFLSKAKKSTNAIERLYITMRYLLNKGYFSPKENSGKTLKNLLLLLKPEIYGSISEKDKVELNGLIYVFDRLPIGIESCRYISLTSNEGYIESNIKPIIALKRTRKCYRIDNNQMNIEITRGRSDIYDILTHLTFLFIEGFKIMNKVYKKQVKNFSREWNFIEKIVLKNFKLSKNDYEVGLIHLSSILGRTFQETKQTYKYFKKNNNNKRLFNIIYWLGKKTIDETIYNKKRIISFSSVLRDSIGHHFCGEIWANNIKNFLKRKDFLNKKIHIISSNMYSVITMLYAAKTLNRNILNEKYINLYKEITQEYYYNNNEIYNKILSYASQYGTTILSDKSGTNINVQIIDLSKIDFSFTIFKKVKNNNDILIVIDYAFGEQAFEVMDELLKPYEYNDNTIYKNINNMNIKSISIMGKAGILKGNKGDIMIPNSHIFEGQANNYPFTNCLSIENFKNLKLNVYSGPMITVLGTSLQNKYLLKYFKESTWKVIGIEMEGAHYQKAIQLASMIKKHISKNIELRYAYYASDNPLKTGSTLASGGLGMDGVKPTYIITEKILEQILL